MGGCGRRRRADSVNGGVRWALSRKGRGLGEGGEGVELGKESRGQVREGDERRILVEGKKESGEVR